MRDRHLILPSVLLSWLVLAIGPTAVLAQTTGVVSGHVVQLASATPASQAGNDVSYSGVVQALPSGQVCVAFGSRAGNLVDGDVNDAPDVFVREAGVTTLVRARLAGGFEPAGSADIWNPVAVSAACRLVAFGARLEEAPGVPASRQDVFVHDRDLHMTERVRVAPGQVWRGLDAGSPSLSEDGGILAFDTTVDPLVAHGHVFVVDRTSRQMTEIDVGRARRPAVSGDGAVVAFATYWRGGVPGDLYDDRLWIHDRATGTNRVLAQLGDPSDDYDGAGRPAISFDGRWVAFASSRPLLPADTNRDLDVYLQDTVSGARVLVSAGPDGAAVGGSAPVLSRDGRFVAFASASRTLLPADGSTYGVHVLDRVTGRVTLAAAVTGGYVFPTSFSPDGRVLALQANVALVAADTNGVDDVYLLSLDTDGDGMVDAWETLFGLDPRVPDGEDDADGDGVSNLDEFRAGTHPRGTVRRYLAEGATGFFSTLVTLANPNATPLTAGVSFLPSQASTASPVRRLVEIAPLTSHTIDVGRVPGLEAAEFSTLVEADAPIAVERLMAWDARWYGGHTETGVADPSTTWYFAEGATHSGFDLFYLLQNPGPTTADVEVRYLLPDPEPPLTAHYTVAPHSRRTIWVNLEEARLADTDVSASILSSVPIVAERAMYLGRPGLPFAAGHAAAGVTTPATSWLIAEGATGSLFDLFVLLANPGDVTARVELRYLLPDGRRVTREHEVPPSSRATVWVDYDAPELADTAVSTEVIARDGVPVVAERAMWWPGPTPAHWLEAHAAPASHVTARRWALPASPAFVTGADSYLLLANPGDTPGIVTVRLHPAEGPAVERSWWLPATSRTSVWVNYDFPALVRRAHTTLVEATVPIVVERAEYWQAEGIAWEGGTSTGATPLPER